MKKKTVGILAIQGDYEKHQEHLRQLGVASRLVRLPADLEGIDALIIPGGESTTVNIMLDRHALRKPLTEFARRRPTFGTCAGMIMLAQHIEDNQAGVTPLKLMDIDVRRTAYGRQVHSTSDTIKVDFEGEKAEIPATFIRAPLVTRVGEEVTILSEWKGTPVLLRQKHLLAASFHPELSTDTRLLSYFITDF